MEAPMSGIITQRFVDPGALIQTATSSRTQAAPVVAIARIDRVRALVDVPEPSAPYIRSGSNAAVKLVNSGGQSFPAKVARTGGVLDPASRTLRVEIDVANPGERLRPGMTVNIAMELRKLSGAVMRLARGPCPTPIFPSPLWRPRTT